MKKAFNKGKGLQGQLDSDLKLIHNLLQNLYMKQNDVSKSDMTHEQHKDMQKFVSDNQSLALRTMDAWENQFGEPTKQAEYIRQHSAIEQAVINNTTAKPGASKPAAPKR